MGGVLSFGSAGEIASPAGFVAAVALRHCPFHDRDPAADAPRGLRHSGPDRLQHVHDVLAGDGIDRQPAEPGQRVVAHRRAPVLLVLAAALSSAGMDRDDGVAGFAGGRHPAGDSTVWIAALSDRPGVLEPPLTG